MDFYMVSKLGSWLSRTLEAHLPSALRAHSVYSFLSMWEGSIKEHKVPHRPVLCFLYTYKFIETLHLQELFWGELSHEFLHIQWKIDDILQKKYSFENFHCFVKTGRDLQILSFSWIGKKFPTSLFL